MNSLRLTDVLIAVLVVCVFLSLACGIALTKRPWCDEACFAYPAVDLITRGSFGQTDMDSSEFEFFFPRILPRAWLHTYFITPLDPLLQAGWFKLFGVSVFTMRSLHTVLGLAALFCWGFLVLRLTGLPAAALLAMALIAVDRITVLTAADGRPDMTGAAFGVAALAIYMGLRARSLGLAIFWANVCLAAAVLSHPNAGLAALGFLYLAFHFDRTRLAWRHILVASIPYFLAFGLWGWYISIDPEAFRFQFLANVHAGPRLGGLSSPLLGFWREITIRYMERSYLPPYATGWSKLMVLIPALYCSAVICCSIPPTRNNEAARILSRLALLYFALLSVLEGRKNDYYLVHMTPLLCCCAAVWIYSWWIAGGWRRLTGVAVMSLLVVLQVGWSVQTIRHNSYRQSYTTITAYIKQHAGPHPVVMGGGELGFDLGFYGPVLTDSTLGYYSGRTPDFVVVDDKCLHQIIIDLQAGSPAIYQHVMKVINQDCEEVFTSGNSLVYACRQPIRSK